MEIYHEDGTGWVAKKMERVDDKGEEVLLEGYVETVPSADTFVIGGVTVSLSNVGSMSVFVGDKAEVKGTYDAEVLTASEVSISSD